MFEMRLRGVAPFNSVRGAAWMMQHTPSTMPGSGSLVLINATDNRVSGGLAYMTVLEIVTNFCSNSPKRANSNSQYSSNSSRSSTWMSSLITVQLPVHQYIVEARKDVFDAYWFLL